MGNFILEKELHSNKQYKVNGVIKESY